jgi:hypothetical protein
MENIAEKEIAELCKLVSNEKDQSELKRLITQLIARLHDRQLERADAKPNGSSKEPGV